MRHFIFGGENLIRGSTASAPPSLSTVPAIATVESQRTVIASGSSLSLTVDSRHSPPLAFVTLMHWLDNISGMVIPRFPPSLRDYILLPVVRGFSAAAQRGTSGSMISLQNNSGEWMN